MVALRRDDLLVESVNDELLVFNPRRSEATALNRSAALVFELCDGSNTIASIRAALDAAGLAPSSDDAVWLALSDLAEADLVELQLSPPTFKGRRELIKMFGLGAGALAALPVVETIKAPAAGVQGSVPGATPAPGAGSGGALPTIAPSVAPTASPTLATPAPATPSPSSVTFAPTSSPTSAPTPSTPFPTSAPTPAPTPAP